MARQHMFLTYEEAAKSGPYDERLYTMCDSLNGAFT
jgi:hypothetical protein